MTELRKQLSTVQMRQLLETQATVNAARNALQRADLEANRVLQMIYDFHSIPTDWVADIDNQSSELVCRPSTEQAADKTTPLLVE
jgi:hypothetical protein